MSQSTNLDKVEASLKDLLEQIIMYLEKFVDTDAHLKEIEQQLQDYDDLPSLVLIIKNIFMTLTVKIDSYILDLKQAPYKSKIATPADNQSIVSQGQYEKLERQIQKYEQDIRNHIKVLFYLIIQGVIQIEQQLKLYTESVQQKLEESEQQRLELLESTKKMINEVKRENQKLTELLRRSQKDQDDLNKKLQDLDNKDMEQQDKLKEFNQLQEKINVLQEMLKESMLCQLTKKSVSPQRDIYEPISINQSSSQYRKIGANKMAPITQTEQSISYRKISSRVTPQKIQGRQATPNLISKRGSIDLMQRIEAIQNRANILISSPRKENHLDRLYDYVKKQDGNEQGYNFWYMFRGNSLARIYGRPPSQEKKEHGQYSSERVVMKSNKK